MRITLNVTEQQLEQLKLMGFDVEQRMREIQCDKEIEILEKWISAEPDPVLIAPADLKSSIEALEGEELKEREFGAAMKSLGFKKVCKRVDGKPKHLYLVAFGGRWSRFRKAQKDGLVVNGVRASDFDNPDLFNLKVEENED